MGHRHNRMNPTAEAVVEFDLHPVRSTAPGQVLEYPVGRVFLVDGDASKAREVVLEGLELDATFGRQVAHRQSAKVR